MIARDSLTGREIGCFDEVYVKLNGETVYLWRAVDHKGEVIESVVTKTMDKLRRSHSCERR